MMIVENGVVAIIGLGQLGELLSKRVQASRLLLVSSDERKSSRLAAEIPGAEPGSEKRLHEASVVVMALPAHTLIPYYEVVSQHLSSGTLLVNPATLISTEQLRKVCPKHTWIGMKLLGSVKELSTGKRGILITDSPAYLEMLQALFSPLGTVLAGDEDWVASCNRIATYHALEACLRIEADIRRLGIPEELIYAAQTTVAKGILQSYPDGTLGHFGKTVLDQVLADRRNA
ncbi:NAD(P)-binding domain-containing protein [Brevibacillus massiliensis]|uniref:NAD(P)-binding domain-containing protein n=1 Tax=Brevibacillus massiliensis TaxID=1118054 RepID=UPI0009D992B6|nr:NAD(P)-binding domain-containing protein [Brevibacillus massiliensis]